MESKIMQDAFCPMCGSDDIQGEAFDACGDNTVTQNMGCSQCGTEWENRYILERQWITSVGNKKGIEE